MSSAVPVLGAMVVAVVSALGAYLAAAKRLSGKIAHSEADSLWKESASIRDDYARRLTAADERQARLEERVARLEAANNELAAENVRLMRETLDCQGALTRLRDERDDLRAEVQDLQTRLKGRRRDDD